MTYVNPDAVILQPGRRPRALGYASNLRSDGSAFAPQIALIENYAREEDFDLTAVFGDKRGPEATAGRSGLQGIVAAVAHGGINVVVVETFDRLSPDYAELRELLIYFAGHGADVHQTSPRADAD